MKAMTSTPSIVRSTPPWPPKTLVPADDHRADRLQQDVAGAEQRLAGDHPAAHQESGDGGGSRR